MSKLVLNYDQRSWNLEVSMYHCIYNLQILEKSRNKKSVKRGKKIKRRSIYQIDIGIDHVIEYGDEQRLI